MSVGENQAGAEENKMDEKALSKQGNGSVTYCERAFPSKCTVYDNYSQLGVNGERGK